MIDPFPNCTDAQRIVARELEPLMLRRDELVWHVTDPAGPLFFEIQHANYTRHWMVVCNVERVVRARNLMELLEVVAYDGPLQDVAIFGHQQFMNDASTFLITLSTRPAP